MNHWLLKTESDEWSWAMQVKKGIEGWSGVRNAQAANNLRAMRNGDHCFFYHTGEERRIVGVVEVVREHYPDPSDESGRFVMVDVRAVMPVIRPVTLEAIKADPKLGHLLLVRNSRLSVSPIDAAAWARICAMAGVTA
jgi:predicted RNA-binding protein with PUA-like domain